METARRYNSSLLILIFIVIAVFSSMFVFQGIRTLKISFNITHAPVKHTGDFNRVRNSCNDPNNLLAIITKDTWFIDRKVIYCMVGKDLGIWVFDKINGKWEEITAYVIRDVDKTKIINTIFGDLDKYDTIEIFAKWLMH